MKQEFRSFYDSKGICTDTRNIKEDSLFVCIKGTNFDGNEFAENALKQGAKHVIVDNPEYFIDNGQMTLVNNSVTYLQELANYHRKKFNIPVIGITGSNGKTTNKELIIAVLSKQFNVLGTKGNLNNHLGVPFTLLELNEAHEIAVIEMGANKAHDIAELCAIAEPNMGIITNIGKAHLEGFLDFAGVLKTKKELYDSVSNCQGTLFVNNDDPVLMKILPNRTENVEFGQFSGEITGKLLSLTPFVNLEWNSKNYHSPTLETNLVGKYNFYNFLAAICIGTYFNVAPKDIDDAITTYLPTNNRSQVSKTVSNTLILDCYNANPTSMMSALESFNSMEHSSKIAILGDMKELGQDSLEEHVKIVDYLTKHELNAILVGSEFGKTHPSMLHFNNVENLNEYLAKNQIENKLILLKGSRSIQLEKAEVYL